MRGELESQLEAFKAQLAEAPGSSEALEGAAVVNARLGNFKVGRRAGAPLFGLQVLVSALARLASRACWCSEQLSLLLGSCVLPERLASQRPGRGTRYPPALPTLLPRSLPRWPLSPRQEAVDQLQRLTEAKPKDADVWRVLAESQDALGDRRAALESYRRAWAEVQAAASPAGSAPGSLEVLQGLAGELVAAGQEQQVRAPAAALPAAARACAHGRQAAAGMPSTGAAGSRQADLCHDACALQAVELVKGARELAAALPGAAEPPAAGTSGGLGPVEVELLLGKTYSQWRGHTAEALAVYDALTEVRTGPAGGQGCMWAAGGVSRQAPGSCLRNAAHPVAVCGARARARCTAHVCERLPPRLAQPPPLQSRPDDFRGFLAKGLLLREQGRMADAQRAFIQVRGWLHY